MGVLRPRQAEAAQPPEGLVALPERRVVFVRSARVREQQARVPSMVRFGPRFVVQARVQAPWRTRRAAL